MSDGSEPSEDEVIRERKFRLQGGIDLASFLGDDGLDEATEEPVAPPETAQQGGAGARTRGGMARLHVHADAF